MADGDAYQPWSEATPIDDVLKRRLGINLPQLNGPLAQAPMPGPRPPQQPLSTTTAASPLGIAPPSKPPLSEAMPSPQPTSTYDPSASPMPEQLNRAEQLRQQGPPQLRGVKSVLDSLARTFPLGVAIEGGIPGSPGYYQRQLGEAEREEAQGLSRRSTESEIDLRKAEAEKARRVATPEKAENLQQNYADAVADAQRRNVDPAKDPAVQQWADAITAIQKEPKGTQTKYEAKQIQDPKNPSKPKDALFDAIKGQYLDPDTKQVIPNARPFEKPEKASDVDNAIRDYMAANNLPNTPANRVKARAAVTQSKSEAATTGSETAKGVAKTSQAAQAAETEYNKAVQFAKTPSPTNDAGLLMAFIGVTKPESVGKIRFQMNELKYMEGTRSSLGDLEALGQRIASGQRLTPQQRQDMLKTMKIIVDATKRTPADEASANAKQVILNGQVIGTQTPEQAKRGTYTPTPAGNP